MNFYSDNVSMFGISERDDIIDDIDLQIHRLQQQINKLKRMQYQERNINMLINYVEEKLTEFNEDNAIDVNEIIYSIRKKMEEGKCEY